MLESELAEIGTWSMHLITGIVESDANLRRIFGLPLELPTSQIDPFMAQVHPDDQAGLAAAIDAVVSGDAGDHYEAAYRTMRASDTRQVVACGHLEKDATGNPLRLRGVVVDLTNRRAAEQALSAEKNILELGVTDSVAEMIEILQNMLVSTFRAKAAGIWHRGKDPNLLERVANHELGDISPMVGPVLDIRYNSFKPCWVARYGQPFAGPTEKADLQFDQAWLERSGVSYAGIYPLLARNRVVGVMGYFGDSELPSAIPKVLSTVAAVYGSHLNSLYELESSARR